MANNLDTDLTVALLTAQTLVNQIGRIRKVVEHPDFVPSEECFKELAAVASHACKAQKDAIDMLVDAIMRKTQRDFGYPRRD